MPYTGYRRSDRKEVTKDLYFWTTYRLVAHTILFTSPDLSHGYAIYNVILQFETFGPTWSFDLAIIISGVFMKSCSIKRGKAGDKQMTKVTMILPSPASAKSSSSTELQTSP